MDVFYISSLDKYMAMDGTLYTDEELDFIDELERRWKESVPQYTFQQLIEIFPEAIPAARRGVRNEIKQYKKLLAECDTDQEDYYNTVIARAHFKEQNEIKEDSDTRFAERRRRIEHGIKRCAYRLALLDEKQGKKPMAKMNGVSDEDIIRAKEVPIESLYSGRLQKSGKRAKGKCPFHNDKTASFTIYRDQNSFYCYGCHVGGSVVDFVMRQEEVDFLAAVKQLIV